MGFSGLGKIQCQSTLTASGHVCLPWQPRPTVTGVARAVSIIQLPAAAGKDALLPLGPGETTGGEKDKHFLLA